MQRITEHNIPITTFWARIRKKPVLLFFLFSLLCLQNNYCQDLINRDAKKYYQSGSQLIEKKNFNDGQLNTAIENLQKAFTIDSAFANTSYYLGLAFYYQKDYPSSNQYFNKYKSRSASPAPDYYLYAGIVQYKLTNNVQAQENLNSFLNSLAADKDSYKDSLARRTLQLSKQSQTLMSKILPSKKENYQGINTQEYDEYYPILTSDRKRIIYNRLEPDSSTGKMVNHLYMYFVDGDTTGPNPRPLPLNNIENREFIVTSINSNGKKILLVSKDSKGLYDVYESEWMVREYAAPLKMYSQINSYADDKFATYGHNDSLIYVVSNRAGGYGGYDIYKINNTSRIMYESIINLGPVINTEYNENYIATVSNSNLLFFTSEGHLVIGESDIFRTRLEAGQYTRPVNLGYPINTTADENTFFPYPTSNMGLSTIKNTSWDITITYLPPKAKNPAYIMQEQYLEDASLGKTTIITPKDE
jgi:hypothetical protein